jgi:hypothetical protein
VTLNIYHPLVILQSKQGNVYPLYYQN